MKYDKLEKAIQKMVESYFKGIELPKNFYGIKVDVYPSKYGNVAHITLMMKDAFSMKDSDFLHTISREAKKFVSNLFGEHLRGGVSTSNTTIDSYENHKWWYDKQKLGESRNKLNFVITEEQYKKFMKSSPVLQSGIEKYLNQYISKGKRTITQKSRNYGNLREDWCVDGTETITSIYYFDDGNFQEGHLIISENLVKTIQSIFSVKESFVIHVFEEWYEDTMLPKFERIVGETGLSIEEIDTTSGDHECVHEQVKPEGITDNEMIDFINQNTLYTRQEIIDKIKSGERDLEDYYLDIADIVKRKEIMGF
jgi:hypothetical protein